MVIDMEKGTDRGAGNRESKSYSDFSCQICEVQVAVLEIKGSGWLYEIQGKFCGGCAIVRIREWASWNAEKEKRLKLERQVDLVNYGVGGSKK